MERLTIVSCYGDVCYDVKSDPYGAYDILDLAKNIDDGDGEAPRFYSKSAKSLRIMRILKSKKVGYL